MPLFPIKYNFKINFRIIKPRAVTFSNHSVTLRTMCFIISSIIEEKQKYRPTS